MRKPSRKRVTAARVTWLSFFSMALIVLAIGLIGSRYVFIALEEEFIRHGAEHNRRVGQKLAENLHRRLAGSVSEEEILSQFQAELAGLIDAEGYEVFLIDLDQHRVMACTETQITELHKSPDEVFQSRMPLLDWSGGPDDPWQGTARAISSEGQPILAYFFPILHRGEGYVIKWVLAVQTNLTELVSSIQHVRGRVDIILMITASFIALFGFISLRRIGRTYERFLEETVDERTQELRAAQAEMLSKTRLATIGQTASMLTHEMRNPLASMKLALSSVIAHDQLHAGDQKKITIALREINRLDELLSQTLDYVRPVQRSDQPVHLDTLIDHTLAVLDPLMEEHGLAVDRRRCPNCPSLRVDDRQMEQALLNVLKNAVEASPGKGLIQCHLLHEPPFLSLSVSNQGAPIPAETLEQIFEPFFTTKPTGSGLGLPLVKRVVEEHGGKLQIESQPSTPTVVTLRLPTEAG